MRCVPHGLSYLAHLGSTLLGPEARCASRPVVSGGPLCLVEESGGLFLGTVGFWLSKKILKMKRGFQVKKGANVPHRRHRPALRRPRRCRGRGVRRGDRHGDPRHDGARSRGGQAHPLVRTAARARVWQFLRKVHFRGVPRGRRVARIGCGVPRRRRRERRCGPHVRLGRPVDRARGRPLPHDRPARGS